MPSPSPRATKSSVAVRTSLVSSSSTPAVGRQRQRAVGRRDAVARGPRERVCLLDERRRRLRLACQEVDAGARVERERQLGERPGLPGGSNVVCGEHVPSLVVPDESGCPTGQPSPAKRFGRFDVAACEGRAAPSAGSAFRPPARRRSASRARRGAGRRRGASDAAGAASAAHGHLLAVGGARQATREQRRGQRVEVGLARQRHVQRLESACRREQQRRRVAPAVGGERDPRPKDLRLGPLEVVERAGLGVLEQARRASSIGAGLVLRLGGGQRPAGASRGLDASTRPNVRGMPRPRRTRRAPGRARRNVPGPRRHLRPASTAACARCQARRSGSVSGSVASASA